MDVIIDDYAEDAVLEVHAGGAITKFEGRDQILLALKASSARGTQTKARRIVVGQNSIAMQVVGPDGQTLIMSIWELENGKIKFDVALVAS